MKRAALTALLFSAAACTSTTPTSVAQLVAPTAVAQVGSRLLILDADRAQARALDLNATARSIVRAPNPIYPLSVPSAPYPNAVTAFTSSDGSTVSSLAFILSTAASQVTVVRSYNLARLGDVQIPDTTSAIAVSPTCTEGKTCPLVLAVTGPSGASLYLAAFDPGLGSATTLEEAQALLPKTTISKVVDLGSKSQPAALAFSPAQSKLLAVADLNSGDDGSGRTGSLALVDFNTVPVSVTRFDVGGPLREVSFDPSGTHLFGIVDALECGTAAGCSGVIGFQIADDPSKSQQVPFPGAAPVPIPGTARGLAASDPNTLLSILNPIDGTTILSIPVVAVSSTDGSVYLVDSSTMSPVPVQSGGATVVSVLDANGVAADLTKENPVLPSSISVQTCATLSETVKITNGGELPSLHLQPGTFDNALHVLTAAGLDFAALKVEAGDRVVFANPPAKCAPGITGIVAAGGVASGTLTLTPEVDLSCLSPQVTFSVQAPFVASGDPSNDVYVVTGHLSGLMGRTTPGRPFTFQGRHFCMAAGADPAAPALQFTMGTGDHTDGASFSLTLSSGLSPFQVPVLVPTSTSLPLTMPGAVAFDPALQNFYVVYEGGAAVAELVPANLRSGSNSAGIALFR